MEKYNFNYGGKNYEFEREGDELTNVTSNNKKTSWYKFISFLVDCDGLGIEYKLTKIQ